MTQNTWTKADPMQHIAMLEAQLNAIPKWRVFRRLAARHRLEIVRRMYGSEQ